MVRYVGAVVQKLTNCLLDGRERDGSGLGEVRTNRTLPAEALKTSYTQSVSISNTLEDGKNERLARIRVPINLVSKLVREFQIIGAVRLGWRIKDASIYV